jgi:hypothetical protein
MSKQPTSGCNPATLIIDMLKEDSMKRILLVFILFVMLTGCVSTHMNKGLQELSGKDIKTAFSVLGYPNEKHVYGDEVVYIWSKKSPIAYYPAGRYTGKAQVSPVSNDCTIRLVSDSRGKIKHCEWSGREQACQSYASKLRNYYRQFE